MPVSLERPAAPSEERIESRRSAVEGSAATGVRMSSPITGRLEEATEEKWLAGLCV
jgi:hypothetical protein